MKAQPHAIVLRPDVAAHRRIAVVLADRIEAFAAKRDVSSYPGKLAAGILGNFLSGDENLRLVAFATNDALVGHILAMFQPAGWAKALLSFIQVEIEGKGFQDVVDRAFAETEEWGLSKGAEVIMLSTERDPEAVSRTAKRMSASKDGNLATTPKGYVVLRHVLVKTLEAHPEPPPVEPPVTETPPAL